MKEFVGKPLPAGLLEQSRTAKGVFRTTNVAGDPIIRATVRSGLTGWLVSATVPTAQIDAPQRRGERFAVLLLGTSLILGLVLGYVFASFISQPLDAATRVAAAVGRDDAPVVGSSPLAEANVLIQTQQTASKELRQRQDHSDFLRRELAHRAKNQLAVVRGMALQTARESGNVDDFVTKLNRRIQGLAGSQDVLVAQNWQGAWLDELVRAQLEVFGAGGRARITGPPLFLETTAVQNIGFALHELATNASKYGCLANDAGHLEIEWDVGPNEIVLHWKEIDGPAVAAPAHKGFGTRVIMELVPQTLQGSVVIHFWPAGLEWRLTIPKHYAVPFPTS
jgi:two-component sensor histidine kinase